MAKDLRDYLDYVSKNFPEHLIRVSKEVEAKYEIPAVVRKLQAEDKYPTLLFEQVKGYEMPVITNLAPTWKALSIILGTSEDFDSIEEVYLRAEQDRIKPVMVDSGPIQEIVMTGDEVDLSKIPIITHAQGQTEPFITAGLTIIKDPETGIRNTGIYRMMPKGKNRLTVWICHFNDGDVICSKAEAKGESIDAVTLIGHHPAFYLGSVYALGVGQDEIEVIGRLLGEPVEMVKCKTVDLEVPAYGEIAIEGKILPNVREPDGCFPELTILGNPQDTRIMEVTAITYRKGAVYHDVYPMHSDHSLCEGMPRRVRLLRGLKTLLPQVIDVWSIHRWFPRGTILVKVRNEYDGIGKRAAIAAMALEPTCKFVIVFDEEAEIRNPDFEEIMWLMATRVVPSRDISIIHEAYGSELDPSSYSGRGWPERGSLNSKVIIDATRTVDRPFPERPDPPKELWQNLDLAKYI